MKGLHKRKKFEVNPSPIGSNIALNTVMITFCLVSILPVILVYSISFTSENDFATSGYSFIPRHFSLGAYQYLFKTADQIVRSYGVSIFVTVFGTLFSLFVMSMFAYVLSRKDFKYRHQLSFYVFFTMLFNGGLVPTYIIIVTVLHLNDNILSLILPYAVSPFYVLVLRTFYNTTIPDSFIESAKIDGAGEITTFFKIIFPLSKPGLATVGLFAVIAYWNDWWLALLYITKPSLMPIQAMLMKVQNQLEYIRINATHLSAANASQLEANPPTESARMALTVVVMTPILFAYPFFQKYFVRGLTLGGVKG